MSEAAETKNKGGRPSIKTPEILLEFCRRIANGRSVANVCKDEDMPDDRSIWRWLSEDEEFGRDYARAIQARAMAHADGIIDLEAKLLRGEIPPDVARVALDARKWTASRLLPKVYGDKQIVEANVTHTHQLHLDALRALSNRRSGNDLGYIDGQAIDITNDPTFSGERLDAPQPALDAVLVVDAAEPPRSRPGGGAVSASPTALYTDEKPSDPPPPPAGKPRTPRAKKSKK